MYDMGPPAFTLLWKEAVLQIFIPLKNPLTSVQFEPLNLGSNGEHVTTRPLMQEQEIKHYRSPYSYLKAIKLLLGYETIQHKKMSTTISSANTNQYML
jgi:hypothetical protein